MKAFLVYGHRERVDITAHHPLNFGIRFLLELIALASYGVYGWSLFDGGVRIVPAIAFPVIGAALWGVFTVPDDPSRSGKTVVAVSGKVRLLLEVAIFTAGVVAVLIAVDAIPAMVLAIVVIIHYAVSYERIRWLLER